MAQLRRLVLYCGPNHPDHGSKQQNCPGDGNEQGELAVDLCLLGDKICQPMKIDRNQHAGKGHEQNVEGDADK